MTTEYYLRLASGREVYAPDGGGFYWIDRAGVGGATHVFRYASDYLRQDRYVAVAVTARFGALDTALEMIPITRVESVARETASKNTGECAYTPLVRFACVTTTCRVRLVDVTLDSDDAQMRSASCPSCLHGLVAHP